MCCIWIFYRLQLYNIHSCGGTVTFWLYVTVSAQCCMSYIDYHVRNVIMWQRFRNPDIQVTHGGLKQIAAIFSWFCRCNFKYIFLKHQDIKSVLLSQANERKRYIQQNINITRLLHTHDLRQWMGNGSRFVSFHMFRRMLSNDLMHRACYIVWYHIIPLMVTSNLAKASS